MTAPAISWPTYRLPYACFSCRKSFKRGGELGEADTAVCPACGGETVQLSRHFKPPKASDLKQWRKVEALVRAGFRFERLGEPYPDTLADVPAFVARHRRS